MTHIANYAHYLSSTAVIGRNLRFSERLLSILLIEPVPIVLGWKLFAESIPAISQTLVQDSVSLKQLFQGKALVPKYKTNEAPPELTKDLQNLRKLVERVIGRLVINWQLETPRHLGESYAAFHLQLCILCDLLQVTFNLQLGNSAHPHALNTIRG